MESFYQKWIEKTIVHYDYSGYVIRNIGLVTRDLPAQAGVYPSAR